MAQNLSPWEQIRTNLTSLLRTSPGTNRGPGVDNLRYVPFPVGGTCQNVSFQNLHLNTVIENTVAIANSIRILYAVLFRTTVANDKVMNIWKMYM